MERKEERGHTSDFKKITAKVRDRFKDKKKIKKFKENCCLHTNLILLIGHVFHLVGCSS